MGLVTALAIGSLVVGIAGTVAQENAQSDAADQAKKGQATVQASNAAKQQQQIRDQIRADRVKRAQIQQASVDTGVGESSGTIGASSALGSQTGNNIANINNSINTGNALSRDSQAAAEDSQNAALFGTVAQLGMSSFKIASGTPQFQNAAMNLFGSPKSQV